MHPLEMDLLQACEAHLRAIPFVRRVRVLRGEKNTTAARVELTLIDGERETYTLHIHVAPVAPAQVVGLRLRTEAEGLRPIVVAPKVGNTAAGELVEAGLPFVDAGGNCHLRIGNRFLVLVQGRPTPAIRKRGERGWGAQGYQVLFAVLTKPDLLRGTVRDFAAATGIPRTTTARTLRNLADEGLLVRTPEGHRVVEPEALLERWLNGYETKVRDHWLIGRYRTEDDDPEALEHRIQETLRDAELEWAWGGGAGAMRLTGYYRGPQTVLHVLDPPADLARTLRALRADDGDLFLFEAPARYMLEGPAGRAAHPLLVFTELATRRDERAKEAAREVWRRYLE